MNLSGLSIRSNNAFITIHDGCILEIFCDRRLIPSDARRGMRARRRKSPDAVEKYVGSGRVWVARGWLVLKADEAASWPRSKEMMIWHPEYDDLHITSIQPDGHATENGFGPQLLICTFHAALTPTLNQLRRLRRSGILGEVELGQPDPGQPGQNTTRS